MNTLAVAYVAEKLAPRISHIQKIVRNVFILRYYIQFLIPMYLAYAASSYSSYGVAKVQITSHNHICLLDSSGFDGKPRVCRDSLAVPSEDRHGPDQSCPSYVYT